jgi:hypothetical protein
VRPWRARRRRDERGVSLVLVLVTLVVFGLLVPILGQFGSTNGVSGYLLTGQRYDRYAAETGMQEAIAWAQTQRVVGRNRVPCSTVTDSVQPTASTKSARTVNVRCQGFRGSGDPQSTPSIPQYALLTLNGGNVTVAGRPMRTDGAWYSSGGIDASRTRLDATADYVGAARGCSGVNASPTDCGTGRPGTDPGYTVPVPPVPTRTPVDRWRADCSGIVNGIVRIDPGLHWQRSYFNDLGDGRCGDVTIWFAPGDGSVPHVFDFTFYDPGATASWTVDVRGARVRVVSGTPLGGNPAAGCDPTAPAAALIAAGGFWLDAASGATLDLCGSAVSGQRIAMSQVVRGTNPAPVDAPKSLVTRIDANPPTFFAKAPPAPVAPLAAVECAPRATCAPDTYLSGSVTGRRATGEVVLTVPDPIPTGASPQNLTIALSHREREANRGDLRQLRLWITGLGSRVDCGGLSDPRNTIDSAPDWSTGRTDQLTCDLTRFHEPYFPQGPLQLHVAVDTGNGQGDNRPDPSVALDLDQVAVAARFTPAGTRDSKPARPIIEIHSGVDATFAGTVYLPVGDVTVDLGDATPASGFRRGLVARNVSVTQVPNDPRYAPFSLPNGGSYTDRTVTFAAYLTNGSNGDPNQALLTARVRFCDPQPDGGHAAEPECNGQSGQEPVILSWDPTR